MTTRSDGLAAISGPGSGVLESICVVAATVELLLTDEASRRARDPAAFRTRFVRLDDDEEEDGDPAVLSPLLVANVPYPPPPLVLPLAGAMATSPTEELSGVYSNAPLDGAQPLPGVPSIWPREIKQMNAIRLRASRPANLAGREYTCLRNIPRVACKS